LSLPVTVDFSGRTGNHLFQYTMARLVAEANGRPLGTQFPKNDFLQPKPYPTVDVPAGLANVSQKIGDYSPDIPLVNIGKNPAHLHGFFQKARYYNQHRGRIREFWNTTPVTDFNVRDIVLHLRLTDYHLPMFKCVINPLWYIDILSREEYDRVYIVVEPHETNSKYLSYFRPYNPIVVGKTPGEDFNFIRSFDKIVCSNSTFCWWASFLSHASTIYTFKPWMGLIRGAVPELADMEGATVLDGEFYRDRYLEEYDWKEYWKK
jgi:hypothetical protein